MIIVKTADQLTIGQLIKIEDSNRVPDGTYEVAEALTVGMASNPRIMITLTSGQTMIVARHASFEIC